MGLQSGGAIAPGSGRHVDVVQNFHNNNGVGWNGHWQLRGGGNYGNMFPSGTNWGLASSPSPDNFLYKGVGCLRIHGGANQGASCIGWVTDQPANQFAWPCGLWIIEAVLAWPTNSANVDNGLIFGTPNFERPVQQASPGGMEIWNNNGVLTWTMNGAITENIAINTGQPLTEWTKVRIEFRNATATVPANLSLIVNDVLVLSRGKNQIPPLSQTGNPMMKWGFGVFDITNVMYMAQLSFYAGPDNVGV